MQARAAVFKVKMKYLQGVLLALAVLASLVSARPTAELDFGAKVRKSLQERGINLDKVLATNDHEKVSKELLGDIWSDCGWFFLVEIMVSNTIL